jgi:hypothetical protein
MFEDCRTPPLLEPHETATVDSGCKGHFLLVNAPCLNKTKSQNPLTVRLPTGATIDSTHTAALNIPELNKAASVAHVFPGMANHSLLSVGQLFNEGYTVTFRNLDHNLQFAGASNFERRSRLEHWTLANKSAQITSTTTTCSRK